MKLRRSLEITGLTDPGRVRDHNEDTILAHPDIGLAVLADGMGGYRGGEIASAIAVRTVCSVLEALLPELRTAEVDSDTGCTLASLAVGHAVRMANETVYETARRRPEYQGMGTTLVVLLFYGNRVTVAHIGDSRLYRIRAGELRQITRDHTLLQELVDGGLCTLEEARLSRDRHVITRAVGVDRKVCADIHEDDVAPGDLYLLCSDGLNDMVADEDIRETLTDCRGNLHRAADRLVRLANERGGHDNVSVVLGRARRPFAAYADWLDKIARWI